MFLQTDDSTKADIQGYIFQHRAFELEDDKEPEKLLKAGAAFMEVSLPSSKDWHYLFSQVCKESADLNDLGVELRNFCLNLAASDPLELFAPEEMDTEGNLFCGHHPAAWLAATLCMGSIYLFYDIELQDDRLSAQTVADMLDDDDEYLV